MSWHPDQFQRQVIAMAISILITAFIMWLAFYRGKRRRKRK